MFEYFYEAPDDIQEAVREEIILQVGRETSVDDVIIDYEEGGELFEFYKTSEIYGKTGRLRANFWEEVLIGGNYKLFYDLTPKEVVTGLTQDGEIFMI